MKTVLIALTLSLVPAAAVATELDDSYAVSWKDTPIIACTFRADLDRVIALSNAGRLDDALKTYDCMVLKIGDRVLKASREYYYKGIWDGPDGRQLDVWAVGGATEKKHAELMAKEQQ